MPAGGKLTGWRIDIRGPDNVTGEPAQPRGRLER